MLPLDCGVLHIVFMHLTTTSTIEQHVNYTGLILVSFQRQPSHDLMEGFNGKRALVNIIWLKLNIAKTILNSMCRFVACV